jgi:hypothetical protein
VDEAASLEVDDEVVLVSDDDVVPVSDDPDEVVEFEFEFVDEEVESNSLAAATEKAAVSTAAPVASQRFVRETRPRPRLRAAGVVSDARVMPCILDASGERPRRSASEFSYANSF